MSCIQLAGRNLYRLLVGLLGEVDRRRLRLLEVGSGRGGGARFCFEHFGFGAVTGMDLCPTAVALANASTGSLA